VLNPARETGWLVPTGGFTTLAALGRWKDLNPRKGEWKATNFIVPLHLLEEVRSGKKIPGNGKKLLKARVKGQEANKLSEITVTRGPKGKGGGKLSGRKENEHTGHSTCDCEKGSKNGARASRQKGNK